MCILKGSLCLASTNFRVGLKSNKKNGVTLDQLKKTYKWYIFVDNF